MHKHKTVILHQYVNLVHAIKSPGNYVAGGSGNKQLYPKGTEVMEYFGKGFAYREAKYERESQTWIDE